MRLPSELEVSDTADMRQTEVYSPHEIALAAGVPDTQVLEIL